ncbi:MAG: Rne/Rng family ribonuclease [Candidatus Omnitrophota bacterium]|nr:MAG: Rne/Rng family ribonuclease [Candidatus Omnitrophota bacterium]
MYQEILINVELQEKRVAITEGRSLEEFYVERQGAQRLVGNIYKGVVETLVPAIGAAFVKIGLPKNGFLYVQDLERPDYEKMAEIIDKPYAYEGTVSDNNHVQAHTEIKDKLKVGQEILVQIVKEPLGTKGARLTTHIALPGRYLVLMPCDSHLGISRRIKDVKERARLKELLKSLNIPRNMGLIVRTAGAGGTKREFLQDLRYLTNLWRRIRVSAHRKHAPALIHEEYDLILRTIRDNFTLQANKLWIDSKEEYKRIMRFLSIISPNLRSRVQLYRSDVPMFERRGVEDEIIKIYDRKVSLPSGGYIMIEPTEGLVAIDVNSGKFTRKKDPEETACQVNLEAAREIARQMRLRDIGGIIIIDFIDMKRARHRQRVFDALNEALRRDHAKTDISTVSELGLIEMTRQRVRRSLESVAYQSCAYCQGRGLVKSPATMAILVLREIRKRLQKANKKTILVFAHPNVVTQVVNEDRQAIHNLEAKFKTKILVRDNPRLHIEEFKIEVV